MGTVYKELHPEQSSFPASAFAVPETIHGTNFPFSVVKFNSGSANSCFFKFIATDYGSGNLTLTPFWLADSASSGTVIWEARVAAVTANTDTQDFTTKALATANTSTDTHLGTTNKRLHSDAITISNTDSIAPGDLVVIELKRNGGTMSGYANLVAALLQYSDT